MALSAEERAALETQLAQARDALHRLELGEMTASVSYQGEQVTYSAADRASLRYLVRALEAQLGLRRSARARGRGVVFG